MSDSSGERIHQEDARKSLWLYEGVVCVAASPLRLIRLSAQWSFATAIGAAKFLAVLPF